MNENLNWVRDFGAVGDGVNNDTQAFVDALAAGKIAMMDEGNFLVDPDVITLDEGPLGHRRPRAGAFSNIIVNGAGGAGIKCDLGLYNMTARNFSITRNAEPNTSAYGIDFGGRTDQSIVEGVVSRKHFTGIRLGAAAEARMRNCKAEQNMGDGFLIVNDPTYGSSSGPSTRTSRR